MKLWILIMVFAFVNANAQKIELINSGKLIEDGIKQHDAGNFEQALQFYEKVDRNDTNYAYALVEKALTLNAVKKYEASISVCKEALQLPDSDKPLIYNVMGTAYDELGQKETAIEVYKSGIRFAPFHYLLYYNIALTYSRLEKYDSCIVYAKKAIDCNIYHASSHFLLGEIYHKRGLQAQAMMALQMFLLLEQNTERTGKAIDLLIATCQINEIEDPITYEVSVEDKIFENINTIIKSKVAVNSKYKTPIKKIKDPIISQMYVLIEKLEPSIDHSNFWNRNYTKYFKAIYTKEYFLPHVYLILSSVRSKQIRKEIEKKKSDIDKYIKWAVQEINDIRGKRYVFIDGKYQTVSAWFEKNNTLSSFGEINNSDEKNPIYLGNWHFYQKNGSYSGCGFFNESGKAIDKWFFYYPDGTIKEERLYENGLNTEKKLYYYDGVLSRHIKLIGSPQDYNIKEYHFNGNISNETIFKNDKRNDKSISYYSTGEKMTEIVYKDDVETEYTEYFESGTQKARYLSNEKIPFEVVFYHENGKVSGSGNFLLGKQIDKWKWFYETGIIKKIENFDKEGRLQDTLFEYGSNGKLSQIIVYTKGKKNGAQTCYDHDGKLHYTIIHKNSVPISYKYYDKQGVVISTSDEKRGILEFKSTYPSGEPFAEGRFRDGEKDGIWKYYYRIGTIKKEETYTNGILNGHVKAYFDNGALQFEYFNKNDKADGYYKRYFRNGNIEKEGWYVNDKMEGYWYTYNIYGKLEEKSYYLHDNLYGYQQDFRFDGSLYCEKYYKDNLLRKIIFFDLKGVGDTIYLKSGNGIAKQKSDKGKLIAEFSVKNGLYTGEYKKYHANGQLSEIVEYSRGKRNGVVKVFDKKGNITCIGNYFEGELDGEWKWYQNNVLKTIGYYKKGKFAGVWKYYYENGKLEEKEIHDDEGDLIEKSLYSESEELIITKKYDHGMLYAYTYLGKDKTYVPDIQIKNETGNITSFFSNGNISYQQALNLGFVVDSTLRYYPNGNLYYVNQYNKNGYVNGDKKIYWPNGKLKAEERYSNGEKHGECKYFRQDGSLERIDEYFGGQLHGMRTFFDNKGIKLNQDKYLYDVFAE